MIFHDASNIPIRISGQYQLNDKWDRSHFLVIPMSNSMISNKADENAIDHSTEGWYHVT